MRIYTNAYIASLTLCACTSAPWGAGSGSAQLKHKATELAIAEVENTAGETRGKFSAGARFAQTLEADSSGSLAGVATTFPPGSLALDTEISLTAGESVALELVSDGGASAALGLDSDTEIEAVGSPVSITSSTEMNASVPFTLSLPIGSGLHLQGGGNLIVIYKSFDVNANALVVGIIPTSAIQIVNGTAVFATTKFGTYQVATSSVPVVEAKEAKVAKLVAEGPVEINEVVPYAAGGNTEVIVTGKNFTPKMTLALGSQTVGKVRVISDAKAAFAMPADVAYGFTTASATQADATVEFKMFARAEKTDYPLITMDAAGVCAGVKYYDAAGNLLEGMRDCGGTGSSAASAAKADFATRAESASKADTAAKAGTAVRAESAARADAVGRADSAARADFGVGRQGSNIVAASNLVLPGDGSLYVVTGNATINSIALAPAGTRVALLFSGFANVMHRSAIRLKDSLSFAASPGDVLELVSIGHAWREIGRSTESSVLFVGQLGYSPRALPGIDGQSQLKFDVWEKNFSGISYNETTGDIVINQPLKVQFEYSAFYQAADAPSSGSFNCSLKLEIFPADNSASWLLSSHYGYSSGMECKVPVYFSTTSTTLQPGDVIKVLSQYSWYSYDGPTTTNITTRSAKGGTTYLKMRVYEGSTP